MKVHIVYSILVSIFNVNALNLPGPLVYVVTPSTKTPSANEGRSAPFYYRNWMRRMDSGPNTISTTSTTAPSVKTPDLIFAEFESESDKNMQKSIRKLLEKERVQSKTSTTTSTTSLPIYVPEIEDSSKTVNNEVTSNFQDSNHQSGSEMTDYFTMYNNLYNAAPAPVYLPSTTQSTTIRSTSSTPPPTTTTAPMNVENIWHIIDNEKQDEYTGKWNELSLDSNDQSSVSDVSDEKNNSNQEFDEKFTLPGLGTNPGNGAENESRAIRTEPNVRFPYVSLKPFQMKIPLPNGFSNSKKGNHMFNNLDNFHELKDPVRGEAQDVVAFRQPVDRYNPAQPYLPQDYGGKSKQSSPSAKPNKAVANLVPPPPPPAPQLTADDFPAPTNYESFPPYPPSKPGPMLPPPSLKPVSVYSPPSAMSDDSPTDDNDNNNDSPPIDLGYRYKPPSFLPTVPPTGYSYNKPTMNADAPQPPTYLGGYSYSKPSVTLDLPPSMDTSSNGYSHSEPHPVEYEPYPVHDLAHYFDKPKAPKDAHPTPPESPSYGDSGYSESMFDDPHDSKDSDDSKDMMGMMPPPPPPPEDMKPDMDSASPPDDHGFPHDFPGDFKYHDFDHDDHDFHYHHHHTTTTTTTTTEMPRVNRYSYYYLGKKLYYLPLYFSVYFIVYVGALIIKAVLRHKIVYPNSWRPNDQTASFFSKRSVSSWDLSNENLHEVTGRVTKAIAEAAKKYMTEKDKSK